MPEPVKSIPHRNMLNRSRVSRPSRGGDALERETGLEPATLSLEG
jgi:hypothetical protein